jgi:hypothetical protein
MRRKSTIVFRIKTIATTLKEKAINCQLNKTERNSDSIYYLLYEESTGGATIRVNDALLVL